MEPKTYEKISLKVLYLEDSPRDAEIIRELLIEAGYDLSMDCAEKEEEFVSLLRSQPYDIILSDFSLPGFDAFRALQLCIGICPDVPFICISGSIGEETAIELLKQGAVDYVLKDRLVRLPFAVKRAIDEAKGEKSRRQAEETLRESKRQISLIYDTVGDIIFNLKVEKDGSYIFNSVNKRFLSTTGLQANQIVGKRVQEVIPEPSLTLVLKKYAEAIREKKIVRWEETTEYPTGRLTGEVSVAPVFDDAMKCISLVGSVHDITERKRVEKDLLLSKQQWENTFDAIADIVCVISQEHEFMAINDAGVQSLKLPRNEIVGKKCFELVHGTKEPLVVCPCKMSLQSRSEGFSEHEQGGRHYSLHAWPIIDDSGKITSFVHTVKDITERKRAEEALRQSEAKYRSIFDNAAEGIYQSTPEGKFLTANPAMARILGFSSPDELIGECTDIARQSYVYPEQREDFKRLMEQQNKVSRFEYEVPRKDGSVAWISETAQAVRDATGRVVRYEGIFIDITERKRAEKELRESEEKYRGIFENVQDVYYEATIEGTILEVSPSIEVISKGQYRRDNLIGKSMWDFYADIGERQALLDVLRERGKVTDFEITLKNKDGSLLPCSISSKIQFDGQGRPEKIIGSMRDVSERKRSEEALQENEKKYRTLVNQNPDGIFIIDLNGSFISFNKAMSENLHYSEEELLTMKIWDIVPEEYLELHKKRLGRILKEGGIEESGEYLVRGKDGKEHYIEVRSVPYFREDKIVGVQGIAHDITDRKKAEEALRQSEQRYKQLLESITDYTYSVEIQNGHPVKTVHGSGCEKVTGFTSADYSVIPKLWFQMVHPDDQKMIEHYADPLCEGKEIPALEHRLIHKNGSVIWVRNTYVLKHDANGKVIGYDGLISDITERKQMENALRKSEETQRFFSERLTNVLEAINDLSKSETFDDLCRNAAVSAKRLMNFDRVGVWFFLPDNRTMQGSFGMDENGNLQDERGMRLPIVERHIHELVLSKKPIILFEDEDLRDYQGNIVGKGSHVVAGLWNGEEIIGLLGADNLIRKHPIIESDIKLLDLYAVSLGHLCTLKRAEEQIQKDLKEKNVMLKEIHHRVKNNLNVISSLLSLQVDRITNKSQALAAFEESKNRIYAMALIHENLYREQDFSRVDLKSFIGDMTQNLLLVYKTDVKIDVRINDLSLDLNNAVPCGLILNELITNALKHAFKDNRKGLIKIVFRILKDNTYELTVQDNGIGLPKEIDIRKTKSLGLLIVNQLIDQIDGVLKITSGKGTKFQITFPVSGA